jgi:alpha-N-arabinofuranosidase
VSNLSRGKTYDWIQSKGDALQFEQVDWYEVLRLSTRMEQIIGDQWTAMGQYDQKHKVKLVVDEYGPWYREGTEVDPTHIFGQQITIRDALATALTLDTFNRHADKVCMATNAQLINNINALFLAHEDRIVATPNFYVFALYAAHQGGQGLRADFSVPDVVYQRDGQPARMCGLNGSASQKGNTITLTVVNPDLEKPVETEIVLRGGTIARASGMVLHAADMHVHNTFEDPNQVKPAPLAVRTAGNAVIVSFPPASVNKLEIVTA